MISNRSMYIDLIEEVLQQKELREIATVLLQQHVIVQTHFSYLA